MPRDHVHVPDVVNPARAGMIRDLTLPYGSVLRKPRASGDDPGAGDANNAWGIVNPARAGMIRLVTRPSSGRSGKPRASGDDPRTRRPRARTAE